MERCRPLSFQGFRGYLMRWARGVVRRGSLPEAGEAAELLAKWRAGDRAAGDQLTRAFHAFVETAARSERRGYLEHQDLAQEGRLALVVALRKFDETTMTAPLPAYVASCVRSRMKRYVMDHLGPVRPTTDEDRAAFYSAPELRPTSVELSEQLAIEPAEAVETILAEDRRSILGRCLDALSPRERDVVVLTNLADEPRSLAEIARESGVTRQTVHGLDRRAMGKMRAMLVDVIGVKLECLV